MGSITPLGVPHPVHKVVKERQRATIVQDYCPVLAADGLTPPFVVDAPPLPDGFHSAGRASRKAHMNRFAGLVCAHGHGAGTAERAESGGVTHGSKLSSA